MTKILAFDTATAACSAALYINGEFLQRFEVAPRRHGNLLLSMIDELLKDACMSLSDCDAIAFGNGPGSFMGLRIAAGVAQGLAYGVGIPVIPISSLYALAQTAYWQKPFSTVLVGWDARMNQIYWATYKSVGESLQVLCPDQLKSPEEIPAMEVDYRAGNAWSIYQERLVPEIKQILETDELCYPTAKAVAYLAADSWRLNHALAPENLELSYLRNRVAEKPNR